MLSQTNVTVTDEVQIIFTSRVGGSKIKIGNTGDKSIFVGAENVTTDNGLAIAKTQTESFEMAGMCSLYGVVASGTADIVILEY